MTIFEKSSSLLMLLSSLFGVSCSILFIFIVIFHRCCHTKTIFLVLNSVIAGFIANTVAASQSIYQLLDNSNDIFCQLRGYLLYTSTGLLYHTLCVQGLQRLFTVVLPTRRILQSNSMILIIVIIQWIISGCFVLPIYFKKRIQYNPISRICLIAINDPFAFLYLGTIIYFFTLTLIILIYFLIVRHMRLNVFTANISQRKIERNRQRREMRLYCRILSLLSVLFIMGIPYCIFFAFSMINGYAPAPAYADRICFFCIIIGYSISMFLSLLFTDNVRNIFMSFIGKIRDNNERQHVHYMTIIPMRAVNVTSESELSKNNLNDLK